MPANQLRTIFQPSSVALIGATDRRASVGRTVLENLVEAKFQGELLLVNPSRKEVLGRPTYASLADVPSAPDVAVIMTPAATVPDVVTDCGRRGVRGAIVISAGFRETGAKGLALEREVLKRARAFDVRFLGPNCLGVLRPEIGFDATFSAAQAEPGGIAVVSQSGALCTAILDWAQTHQVGFSMLVSMGISADIGFGEVLDYLVADAKTDSIMLYVEGVDETRRFMSALRAAARVKPVVVMKVGRHAAGSRAALSHTGALVESDQVFDAALRRAGVLRVLDFADFFSAATILDAGLRTGGDRLCIVTNARGPGVLAADHCADIGVRLADLSPATRETLDRRLPAAWSGGNPVDVLGDASPERYQEALETCLADPGVDGTVILFTPQALSSPHAVAERVVGLAAGSGKPLLACWMGGPAVESARALFASANIPSFGTPESAVDAFAYLAAYRESQDQLLEVPEPLGHQEPPDRDGARAVIEGARSDGRSVLTLAESKAVLAAFRVPIVRSIPARSMTDAALIAQELGFPVVLKIDSPDITHKSDVAGVALGISSVEEVRSAYRRIAEGARAAVPAARIDGVTVEPMHRDRGSRELMVGLVCDPVFGPVVSFGLGGTLVEILKDRAVALPPLNRHLIRSLIARTRAGAWLGDFRGLSAVDMTSLEDLLLRVSEMACELPWIEEMDLNPVLASADGATVLDARIVVRHVDPSARRYDHMAIHPYPSELVRTLVLADGTHVTLRPIRPEDAEIEREFVNGLSKRSRYLRFMYQMGEIAPGLLSRFTQIDYDRDMALIAVVEQDARERQIGVARYSALPDGEGCEFAIVVADEWQGRGVAIRLIEHLVAAARERGFRRIVGSILRENQRMLQFVRTLGFETSVDREEPDIVNVELLL